MSFPAHSGKLPTFKQLGTAKLPQIDCLNRMTSNYAPAIVSLGCKKEAATAQGHNIYTK
jgi:hypothetical protein